MYNLTVLSFLIFCLLYSHTEVDTILGVATVKNRPDQALKPANVLQQMKLYRGNKTLIIVNKMSLLKFVLLKLFTKNIYGT